MLSGAELTKVILLEEMMAQRIRIARICAQRFLRERMFMTKLCMKFSCKFKQQLAGNAQNMKWTATKIGVLTLRLAWFISLRQAALIACLKLVLSGIGAITRQMLTQCTRCSKTDKMILSLMVL